MPHTMPSIVSRLRARFRVMFDQLWATKSKFALPAEIALRCGLRLSEIAGLKSEHIDPEAKIMHIIGKGGRKRTLSIPSLSYCLLGRWLRHMLGGTFRHASIAAAPPKPFECTVGWIAHYTIGVVFALVFVVLAAADWLERPTPLPALLYGVGTVVFPFFILQPSFGLGIAASRTPKPTQARLKSLATHTVFGVGLYLCALGVSYLLRAQA